MGDQLSSTALSSGVTSLGGSQQNEQHHTFHAQLDDTGQPHTASSQQPNSGNAQNFDLRPMSNALPVGSEQSPFEARRPSGQHDTASMAGPSSYQYPQQILQYGQQRYDPTTIARTQQQQQHYAPQQMAPQAAQYQYAHRPHSLQMQTQTPFPRMDPYAFGVSPSAYSPMDMRFPQQPFPMGYGPPAGYQDISQSARRGSETIPPAILSLPRGPPRKPKQSGHALWVGNLPPAATVTDLKDHFSRGATLDIQSLFLISKSNCAFVNYKSEAACVSAMSRFHDSRFHGVRLVCRLRRGSTSTTNATAASETPKSNRDTSAVHKDGDVVIHTSKSSDPLIVGSLPSIAAAAGDEAAQASSTTKVPEKFFVVKSLTLQDLEASARNGIWATQSHNEPTLNRAFNAAENVYLIFSANKSGEYFGYARMCSEIAGEAVSTVSTPSPHPQTSNDGPKSIPTPATETAPAGRIIDDSARGTIFWEAETSDEEESASQDKGPEDGVDGQDLGRPFKIEWISTTRLPFYRTRGLRNPWNANREVKIARDGTELEPSVGKRLVQMFHRPAQVVPPPPQHMHAGGMPPYQMGQ